MEMIITSMIRGAALIGKERAIWSILTDVTARDLSSGDDQLSFLSDGKRVAGLRRDIRRGTSERNPVKSISIGQYSNLP